LSCLGHAENPEYIDIEHPPDITFLDFDQRSATAHARGWLIDNVHALFSAGINDLGAKAEARI
jgi:hypothetical protein